MFDKADVGSPFFMMAIFNAVLFVVTLLSDLNHLWKSKRTGNERRLSGIEERDEESRYRDEG